MKLLRQLLGRAEFRNDGIQDTIIEVNEFDNSMFFLEFDSIIVEHDLHSWGPDADSYLSYFYGLDTMANVTYTNRVSFTIYSPMLITIHFRQVQAKCLLMANENFARWSLPSKAAIVLPLGRYYCNWETKQKFGLNSISEVGSKPANAFQHSFTHLSTVYTWAGRVLNSQCGNMSTLGEIPVIKDIWIFTTIKLGT